MKDYIDSLEEIENMLDYVGELGVYKNGFVSLMKCNDFAKEHFINFNDIFNNLNKYFFKGHHFYSRALVEKHRSYGRSCIILQVLILVEEGYPYLCHDICYRHE